MKYSKQLSAANEAHVIPVRTLNTATLRVKPKAFQFSLWMGFEIKTVFVNRHFTSA